MQKHKARDLALGLDRAVGVVVDKIRTGISECCSDTLHRGPMDGVSNVWKGK
jgi:hypothetical protein